MKRSSWAWGSAYVPSNSIGFWVAITRNGRASSCVEPSTVTRRSCMHSSSPDWVLGEARLISSTSTMFANTGPGTELEASVALDVDVRADEVGREHVGGALHARAVSVDRRGERPRERRLAHARVVLDQHVASGQQRDQHRAHRLGRDPHGARHVGRHPRPQCGDVCRPALADHIHANRDRNSADSAPTPAATLVHRGHLLTARPPRATSPRPSRGRWSRRRCSLRPEPERTTHARAPVRSRCSRTPGRARQGSLRRLGQGGSPVGTLTPGTIGSVRLEGIPGPNAIDTLAVVAFRLGLVERPDGLRAVRRGDRDPDARARAVGVPLEVQRDRDRDEFAGRHRLHVGREEGRDRLERRRCLRRTCSSRSWRACARWHGSSRSGRRSRCRRGAPR